MTEQKHADSDYIVRAVAASDEIRAFAMRSTGIVEEAKQRHQTHPTVTAALGRLLTGGAMMGVMMKGEKDLLTLQIKSAGPIGGMTVTADSRGNVKGYANVPDVDVPPSPQGKLDVGYAVGPGELQVVKDLGLKDPYVSTVLLQSGEIGDDLTYYFAASEQTPSAVGLGGSYEYGQYGEDSRRFYHSADAVCQRRDRGGAGEADQPGNVCDRAAGPAGYTGGNA